MRKWSLIFGLTLASLFSASAQSGAVPDNPRYVFQRIGEDIGLSTLTATSLAQDNDGFMWIGTQSGLIRFDGRQGKHYGVEDGLASAVVDQVLIAPNGRILIGTRKGASICYKNEFMRLPLPDEAVPDPAYQFVAADRQGEIYLATRKGLFQYSFDNPNRYVEVPIGGEKSQPIDAVYVAPDDTVWFAHGRKLGTIRPKQAATWLAVHNQLPEEPVLAILKDGDGTVWIRTAKHIAHYDAATRAVVPEKINMPSANDFGIPAIDREGNLLVPTVAGVYRRKGSTWEAVDRRRGMPVNAVYAVTEDREGAYWIGMAGAGVARWQGTAAWEAWTQAEGLPDNVIWSVRRDKQNRLWVGTNNGIAMWDAQRHAWRVWDAGNGLNGSVVRDIAITDDGAIWVQSYPGGLTRFDPVSLRPQKVVTPKPEPSTVVVGADGRLWIGSRSFIKALKTNRPPYEFEDIEVPPEAAGTTSHVQVIQGVVWTAGRKGIARFDGKKWTVFGTDAGLKPDAITEIAALSKDELWFHYDEANGVGQVRIVDGKPQVRHYTMKDGLPANETYMLGTDGKGNVWTGGPLGLTLFQPSGGMQHFTRSDGLIWDDLDAGAFLADKDGSLFFGTSGGLARYNPERDRDRATYRPPVVITSALLGGKEHFREGAASVPYNENTLRVQFAALTFRDVDRVRCYYQLNGLESEVNETRLREVRYPALPAGNYYRFEVYCRSATGVVSPIARFTFEVHPPWWQRWDTRAVFLAIMLLAIAAVIKLRTSSLERERLHLEMAVAERSQELAKANKELEEASLTDPLTGVRNRRFFDIIITADVNQTVRSYSPPLASRGGRNRDMIFYLIDIDHFKNVNDAFGHAVGDKVLVEISRRIRSVMRQTDVLIRWGGEELLLISRAAERSEAMQLAARVLNAVGGEPYQVAGVEESITCTCSVGWTPFPWFTEQPEVVDYETILRMSDRALYRAKAEGRNRAFGILPGSDGKGVTLVTPETLKFEWALIPGPEVSTKTE